MYLATQMMPCMALAANETLNACDDDTVYCSCDDRMVGGERRITYSCSIPGLEQEEIDWILDTVNENATSFTCTYCHLRDVPIQIHQLTRLKRLSLNGNRGIRMLNNESLPSFQDLDYLGLSLMELENIEAGTFRGKKATVGGVNEIRAPKSTLLVDDLQTRRF